MWCIAVGGLCVVALYLYIAWRKWRVRNVITMHDVGVVFRAPSMTAVLYCDSLCAENETLPRMRFDGPCSTALYYVWDSRDGFYNIEEVLIVWMHHKQGTITIARNCGVDIAIRHSLIEDWIVSVPEFEIGMRVIDDVHQYACRLMRTVHAYKE
jgi:hypothetical protein